MKKRRVIKSRVLFLMFSILFTISLFLNIGASAEDVPFKLTSVDIIDKSPTVTGTITYSDNDEIKNNITFHKLNDSVTFKLVIKNNLGKDTTITSITDNNDNDYITYEYDKHENIKLKANESFELVVKVTYNKELTDIKKRNQASDTRLNIKYLDEGKSKDKNIIINPTTNDHISGSFILLLISSTGLIVCIIAGKKRNKKISTLIIVGLIATPALIKAATFSFNIDFISNYKLYDKEVVSYIVDGKKVEVVVPYGQEVISLDPPTKKGYTFEKWTYEDGTDFDFTKPVTEDIKIIPVFKIDKYSISYDLDGGVTLPDNPTEYTVESKITLINPIKDNYDFAGWEGTGLTKPTKNVVIEKQTGNRSYKALYTPTKYTISYKGLTDDERSSLNNPVEYNIKTESFTLNNPSNRKDEYGNDTEIFVGWKENDTTSSTITLPNVNSMGDKVYEAQWVEADPATYTITYELNGGTVSSSNPTSYTNKTETFTLNNPTLIGHTFKGWSGTGLSGDENKTVKIEKGTRKNLEFEAHYTPNVYTVIFDKNSTKATGSMTDQSFIYNKANNLNENKYTRVGYTFDSWNTTASGSGSKYEDKESVINLKESGSVTLYAMWNANSYEIEFDKNNENATGSMSNLEMTYDTSKSLTANQYSLEGYTFAGWNTKADGTGTSYTNGESVTNLAESGVVKLYAIWSANNYEIVFDKNNENATGSMSNLEMTYDTSKVLTKNQYELEGYTFAGWNTKADGTGTNYADEEVVNNLAESGIFRLYAMWNANGYEIKFDKNSTKATGSMSNLPMTYGESKTLTKNQYSLEGYTFAGWNTKADGSGKSYADEESVSDLVESGTVTLYAKWNANSYEIEFDKNNTKAAGSMSNLEMTYDTSKTLTKNQYSLEGYTFAGWNTKADGTGTDYTDEESVSNLVESGTVTLYAKWNANNYVIEFVKNNENATGSMSNLEMTYDITKALTKNAYSLEGYTFAGWNTKADGSGADYADEVFVNNLTESGTVRLYAMWNANKYEIEFDKNNTNATGEMTNLEMKYDTSKSLTKNQYELEGYTFAGWNTKADGTGTSYIDEEVVNNLTTSDSITLYAKWTARKANISYNKNSDQATGTMDDQMVTYDQPASLSTVAFERVGYTFTRWSIRADGSGKTYNDGADVTNEFVSDTTLYANWQANNYEIEFVGNHEGITVEMANESMVYDTPKALSHNLFTVVGYTFSGWNDKADGTGISYTDEEVVNNLVESGTVKLYAKWTANKYEIIFDKNNTNATGSMSNLGMTYDTSKVLTKNQYSLEGYTFAGWNTKADGTGTSYADEELASNLIESGTVKLYAMWTANNYEIIFDKNNTNATGSMSNLKMTYDEAKELTKNAYSLEGYTFAGWNTKADGSGTNYTDEESVSNLVESGTVRLYAKWQANEITVTFDKNDDDAIGIMLPQIVIYDQETHLSSVGYTKENYTFAGWNTKADGSGTTYSDGADITNVFDEDITLYAMWNSDSNTVTVTFDTDGGSSVSSIEVEIGDSIGTLPTTTKDNYIFKGWYINLEDEQPIDETYAPVEDVELHAKWDMFICKKTATLHTETCNQTDATKFCSGAGYNQGDTITYGTVAHSNTFKAGDALDCNVDGTGYNQRFYYLRTVDNKAILISNKNYTAASGQADQNNSFIYSQAHDQLPKTSEWNTLPVTLDGKAARLITMEDLLDVTGASSASSLSPTGSLNAYEFLFENSNYSGIGERSTQWLEEISPTSRYRYRNDQRNLAAVESGKENTSKNPVRPVIEVPLNLIKDDYVVRYNPNGGTVTNEYAVIKKGDKLSSLPTPHRDNYIFDGWYTSQEFSTEVTENTIPTGNDTYYAKWVTTVENADLEYTEYNLEIGESKTIVIKNINELEPYSFSSDDPTVASVDNDGIITALADGNTKIKINGTDSGLSKEIVVTVKNESDKYVVKFCTQGGTAVEDIEVEKNQPIGTLPTSTKEGYDLEGWYTSTSYTTKVTPETVIDSNKVFYANWIPANKVAEVDGKYYDSIQKAIDEETSTNITVKLLKDVTTSAYIDLYSKNTNKNIVLDLNGHTLTNDTTQVIKTKTYLEIKNGKISCGASNGAVDVEQNGILVINSGRIEHTATGSNGRAAIYNNGGTVRIGGTAYLTAQADGSTSAKRATVQNVKGDLTITGGTIVSTRESNSYAVTVTAGTAVIGTKDDIYDKDAITIRANTNGISSSVAYSLYDGTVEGISAAVSNEAHITGIEDNASKVNTTINIDGINFKALYYELSTSKYKITFDPNGGTVSPTSKSIDVGSKVGELPVPEKGIYTFDGWYDGSTLVTEDTIPEGPVTYTAHWHYDASDEIKEFNITSDAIKDYYASINTWKDDESTFQANMDANFNAHNCKCNENTCSTSGTVLCDKPKGYETNINDIIVYESNESTKEKGEVASYLKVTNGTIYNMIPGETYYWESYSDNSVHGYVKALGKRRLLDTEGTRNTRDLGGLKVDVDHDGTTDGTLKYGKIFRAERLYSDNNNALAFKKLGVTEEIDLRASSEIPSNEAKLDLFKHREIKHYQIDFTTQLDNYTLARNVVKEAMQDVIDGKNIYFHCRIGTDRTGTLAYILEGLLGVEKEDMLEDYELSYFFGLVNRHRFYREDPKSTVSKTQKFYYMYELMPDSEGVYDWFMLGSTDETRADDIKLINDFKAAMINYN